MGAMILSWAGQIALALVLLYLFVVALRHVLRGKGEVRAVGLVAALLLLPAFAFVHWYGDWNFAPEAPLSDPSRWWVIPVGGEGGQPSRTLNLATIALLFSILYLLATGAVLALASWHNRSRGGQIQALHRGLMKWTAVTIGFLVYLHALGISLTPLLFGMGAASIVVGLALQEPLSNLFAGLALDMEGAFHPGDWIRVDVDGGTVGKVIDKGWRTTRLLTQEQELVTLPNRVMGGQKIVNYHKPEPLHAHRLVIGASYKDPPIKVKETLRTILLGEPQIARDPAPAVRTINYGDFAVEYEMRFFLTDYGQQTRVKDEVMTRVWYAFQEDGIEIPFPVRTVHVKERAQLAEEQGAIEKTSGQIADFLRSVPSLGRHLASDDFAFLAANAFQRAYAAGEPVIRKGTMGDAVFFVREGSCEALLPGGGKRRLETGEYFGEMALLRAAARTADVLAAEGGATVVRVDRECMVRLFDRYPGLREEFLRTEDLRRRDSGMARAPEDKVAESMAARLRRAVRNYLVPW